MRGFTTGVLAGAILGAGMAIMVHPIDGRDARRIRNRAVRTARNVSAKTVKLRSLPGQDMFATTRRAIIYATGKQDIRFGNWTR